MIVDDIRKSYSERLKKWITELENKINKKIKKINKISSSEIVRNVVLFAAEKTTSEFVRLRKEVNELSIQIAVDDVAEKAEASAYEEAQNASFEALQTNEAGQILSAIENLESSYFYLNSGDGDYITPYHSNTSIGFAPLYRLQKYRYTEPRPSPLAFLDR